MTIARTNIRLLSLHNFFVNFEPYMPFAIIYFARETGSFALGMSVFSIVMLSSAVFEVPTGVLSDLLGRTKTILLGSIAGLCGVICYAIGGSFWMLALGSVFEGFAFALYSGNNEAFLHDTLKQEGREEDFAHILGRTSSFFQAGLGFSALLGSAIAYFFPLEYVFWAGAVPRFLCIVTSLCMREPRIHEEVIETNVFAHLGEALRKFRNNAKLRTLSIASILNFGVSESSYRFTPVFFSLLWPVWAIGIARVVSNAMAFLSFWFAGSVIRKYGALPALIAGKSSARAVALIAYTVPTVVSPLLLSCTSVFHGLVRTAESTLFQKEFTHRQRATMGSLNQFAGSIVFGIFAFCFGLIADGIGPIATLMLTEVVLILIILLYWRVFRHDHTTRAPE